MAYIPEQKTGLLFDEAYVDGEDWFIALQLGPEETERLANPLRHDLFVQALKARSNDPARAEVFYEVDHAGEVSAHVSMSVLLTTPNAAVQAAINEVVNVFADEELSPLFGWAGEITIPEARRIPTTLLGSTPPDVAWTFLEPVDIVELADDMNTVIEERLRVDQLASPANQ